jgi:site-specific recombinase XerD
LRGRAVGTHELASLFAACSRDANAALGARDAAILALLYGAGLRRAEAAGVAFESFDAAHGRLRVLGKGSKERDVYLVAGTLAAVLAWLERRGRIPGPLFNQVSKTGDIRSHGITAQLIYHIARQRHLEAGIKPFTPHDLRRSFIAELLDEGVDLATVARQVGHANVQTTARYDRRDDTAQQRGILRLDVPFTTERRG